MDDDRKHFCGGCDRMVTSPHICEGKPAAALWTSRNEAAVAARNLLHLLELDRIERRRLAAVGRY